MSKGPLGEQYDLLAQCPKLHGHVQVPKRNGVAHKVLGKGEVGIVGTVADQHIHAGGVRQEV